MKQIAIAVGLCLPLVGCGTYQLGRAFAQNGETQDQVRLAVLDCQDRARNEANSDERVAASFVAGLTIVGAPIAIAEERRKTREVWQDCMKAKGYRVEPPDKVTPEKAAPASSVTYSQNPVPSTPALAESPKQSALQPTLPSASNANSGSPKSAKDATAALEKLNELRAKGLITDAEYQEKRKAILDAL